MSVPSKKVSFVSTAEFETLLADVKTLQGEVAELKATKGQKRMITVEPRKFVKFPTVESRDPSAAVDAVIKEEVMKKGDQNSTTRK
jgi:hypothetical protein